MNNINTNEVHIWKLKIPYYLFDKSDFENGNSMDNIINYRNIINIFRNVIDEEEIKSAARFYKFSDQIRYIVTRYVLKKIISNYLNLNPKCIQFFYNKFSKPYIIQKFNSISLQFNLSHAGEYIVFAFTRDFSVGIDIELYDRQLDMQALKDQIFSEQELLKWKILSEQEKLISFFHVWSCKEAFLKGIGTGLSCAPNSFSVNINPNEKPILLNIKSCKYENDPSAWNLCTFHIQNNYSAVFAVKSKSFKSIFYEWNESNLFNE